MKRLLLLACLFCLGASAQNLSTSGTISAASAANICTATSCVYYQLPSGATWVTLQITGTWSGSVGVYSITSQNATYQNLNSQTWTQQANLTANGTWAIAAGNSTFILVQSSSFSSGSANITMTASSTGSPLVNPILAGNLTVSGINQSTASTSGQCWNTQGGVASCGYGPGTVIPISSGGTGATTSTAALTNLFAAVSCSAGQYYNPTTQTCLSIQQSQVGVLSARNNIYFLGDSYGTGVGMPSASYGLQSQIASMMGYSSAAPWVNPQPGNTLDDIVMEGWAELGYNVKRQNQPILFVDCCANNANNSLTPAQGEQDFIQAGNALVFEASESASSHTSATQWTQTSGTWTEIAPLILGGGFVGHTGSNYTIGDTICFVINSLCTLDATITNVSSGGVPGTLMLTSFPPQYNKLGIWPSQCIHCQNGSAAGAEYDAAIIGAVNGIYAETTSGASSTLTVSVSVGATGVAVINYIAENTAITHGAHYTGGGTAQVFLDGGTTPLVDQTTNSSTLTGDCGGVASYNTGANCVYAAVFTGIAPGTHTFAVTTTSTNTLPFSIIDIIHPAGSHPNGGDGPSMILSTTAPTLSAAPFAYNASQYSLFAQNLVTQANLWGETNVRLADEAKWSTTQGGGTPTNPVALGFNLAVDWANATPTTATGCAVDGSNNVTVYGTNSYTVGQQVFLYSFVNCSYLNGFDNTLNTLQPFTITSATSSSFVASSPSFTHASTGGEVTDTGATQLMVGGSIASNEPPLHPAQAGYTKFAQVMVAAANITPGMFLSSYLTQEPPTLWGYAFSNVTGVIGTSSCPMGTSGAAIVVCNMPGNNAKDVLDADLNGTMQTYITSNGNIINSSGVGFLSFNYFNSTGGSAPIVFNGGHNSIAGRDISNSTNYQSGGNVILTSPVPPSQNAPTATAGGGTLNANTQYCARLTGVNDSGAESLWSNEECVTTGGGSNNYSVTYSYQSAFGNIWTNVKFYCRTPGAEQFCYNNVVGNGSQTWVDNGSVTPSGNPPSIASNAKIVFTADSNYTLANAPRSYPNWHIASSLSNTNTPYGQIIFASRGGTIESITVNVQGSITCSTYPTYAAFDCGTSVTGCASGGTSLASQATTGDGQFGTAGLSAAIPIGHYVAVKETAGSCTVSPTSDISLTVRAN